MYVYNIHTCSHTLSSRELVVDNSTAPWGLPHLNIPYWICNLLQKVQILNSMSLTLEVIKIYQRVKYIYIYTRVYLGNPWVLVIGKKKITVIKFSMRKERPWTSGLACAKENEDTGYEKALTCPPKGAVLKRMMVWMTLSGCGIANSGLSWPKAP